MPSLSAILLPKTEEVSLETSVQLFTQDYACKLRASVTCFCGKTLGGMSADYVTRVELLIFKTHLGGERYWKSLFEEITGRLPIHPASSVDTSIWDMIIPIGFKALQEITKDLPSHAGEFHYPLPQFTEE